MGVGKGNWPKVGGGGSPREQKGSSLGSVPLGAQLQVNNLSPQTETHSHPPRWRPSSRGRCAALLCQTLRWGAGASSRHLLEDEGTKSTPNAPPYSSWQSGHSVNNGHYDDCCCYNEPISWLACPPYPTPSPLTSQALARAGTHHTFLLPSCQGVPCSLSWRGESGERRILSRHHPHHRTHTLLLPNPTSSCPSLKGCRPPGIGHLPLANGQSAGSHSLEDGATCRPPDVMWNQPLDEGRGWERPRTLQGPGPSFPTGHSITPPPAAP